MGNYYKDIKKDYTRAVNYYLLGCNESSSDSMYELAIYYKNIKKDFKIMKTYLVEGYKNKNIKCIEELGKYFYSEKKYDLVKKYYEEAIELGSSSSMYFLGMYYIEIERNTILYNKYIKLALKNNNPDALCLFAQHANKEQNFNKM